MEEKKVVGRGIAIGLGVLCIVLSVGLVGAIMYYTTIIINDKNALYENYVSTHTYTDSQYNSLQSQYNNYAANHRYTDSQYDELWQPYVIKVDLKTEDVRPLSGTPHLRVYGYVVNLHRNWANNVRLHVIAYQSGGVEAINTYINLGYIVGEGYLSVDSNIAYLGDEIASVSITPEWTG